MICLPLRDGNRLRPQLFSVGFVCKTKVTACGMPSGQHCSLSVSFLSLAVCGGLLRREHVSAHVVSPLVSKAEAVSQLSSQLRIGLESVLLIDDNAAECAAVSSALPAVQVWCWPQKHAEARAQLEH
eukprot:2730488-Pleurochrysis_carterae.AAC.1